jgi:hypothetical protein
MPNKNPKVMNPCRRPYNIPVIGKIFPDGHGQRLKARLMPKFVHRAALLFDGVRQSPRVIRIHRTFVTRKSRLLTRYCQCGIGEHNRSWITRIHSTQWLRRFLISQYPGPQQPLFHTGIRIRVLAFALNAGAVEFMYRACIGQVALFADFSAIIAGFRRVQNGQSNDAHRCIAKKQLKPRFRI